MRPPWSLSWMSDKHGGAFLAAYWLKTADNDHWIGKWEVYEEGTIKIDICNDEYIRGVIWNLVEKVPPVFRWESTIVQFAASAHDSRKVDMFVVVPITIFLHNFILVAGIPTKYCICVIHDHQYDIPKWLLCFTEKYSYWKDLWGKETFVAEHFTKPSDITWNVIQHAAWQLGV